MTSLKSPLSGRAPDAAVGMADSDARGEHYDPNILPDRVLAIFLKRQHLKRRIAERKRCHHGYLDLESKLVALTTKQLRAERRWERERAKRSVS